MPISVQCASCKANFKAPDTLAGKRVKCPKCSQGIAVPSATSTGSPPPTPPAPTRPPVPKPQKAAKSARLPLLSFDDLKIPPRLRKSVEEEVGDEEILWMGRPTPTSLLNNALIGMIAGLVISILTIVGTVFGLMYSTEAMMTWIIIGVSAVVLLTMGLPMATMPIWVRWLINYRDCYVLTPTRAIVFDNEKILWATPKPHTAEMLANRSVRINKDGTGSIVFGSEVIDLGTRQRHRTRDKKGPQGQKIRETTITTWQEKANKDVGFIDIEDVEQVEAMLREVLQLDLPANMLKS